VDAPFRPNHGVSTKPGQLQNFLPGSPGNFYWVGAFGTTFWVDPSEKLVVIMMEQVPLAQGRYYRQLLPSLVYQAIVR
jgi:CubicO group peptidase (beta-lactamase class C family)